MTNDTTTRRPCPECGSAATDPHHEDNDLSVCFHCRLTFSPGTPDWPDEIKLLNYNAHPLARDVAGELIADDAREFSPTEAPERAEWLFKLLDTYLRKLNANRWMEFARLAPDFAGGTVFDKNDVAYALHHEDQDGNVNGVTAEELAMVTDDELAGAASVLEDWIFNHPTDWPDALQDARDMGRFE